MSMEKKPADKIQDLKKIEADKAEQVKGGQVMNKEPLRGKI